MSTARRPIVHLFVGLHKTGTTALRFMLDVHRDAFARHGYHVPRATWTAYINQFWNGGHNNIPWEIAGNHATLPEFGTVADLVREIEALPEHQHILLSEDLDVFQPAHIARLKEHFAAFDVRVILFVRNQVDWLQALFAEEQKWFTATTFHTWFMGRLGDDRLDFHGVAAKWAAAFGRITIRCHEELRGQILEAFLQCCEAPDALRRMLGERGLPLVNITPGAFPLELIRHAAAFAAESGIEASFFNAMVSPAALTASKQIQRFSRKPNIITAPVAAVLFPMMQKSNGQLSARFGVALPASYLEPVLPPAAEPEPTGISIEELGKILVTTVAGMSLRTAGTARMLRIRHRRTIDPDTAASLAAVNARHYPWPRDKAAESTLLDELILAGLSDGGTALYVERAGEVRRAYRRVQGEMMPLRDFSDEEWTLLMLHVQLRAGLGPVLGQNLRQGYVELTRDGQPLYAWVRHAMTSNGELAVLEDLPPA